MVFLCSTKTREWQWMQLVSVFLARISNEESADTNSIRWAIFKGGGGEWKGSHVLFGVRTLFRVLNTAQL